ncbi:hypothetical protein [Methylomicrobium agile]|uniref:hypothetical protein n=1 Tax=Methylomicrobium agile TaxID=39774 RepID=UPI00055B26BF|nr:hypothetical protein [Methylomicrobium agile]
MKKTLFSTIAIAALTSGCASIIHGATDEVKVGSYPDRVDFTVKNEDGEIVMRGVTPQTISLKRGNGYFDGENYNVEFDRQGYVSQSTSIESGLSWMYPGNLIFGGLVGLLIVDPITGAMWNLDDQVSVTLMPKSASLPK